jgi:hypothetical protein
MRTVRPQGRTFRITQPHGLRLSYMGMHPGLCNRSNRIVIDTATFRLPIRDKKIRQERKWLDCPKYSVLLLHFTAEVRRFVSSALMLSKEMNSFIQTPLADRRILQTGTIPGGSPDVAPYPDMAPFAGNRF